LTSALFKFEEAGKVVLQLQETRISWFSVFFPFIMPLPRDLFADWVAFQASSSEVVIFSPSAGQFVVVAWSVVSS
jgi:hypothetical protein